MPPVYCYSPHHVLVMGLYVLYPHIPGVNPEGVMGARKGSGDNLPYAAFVSLQIFIAPCGLRYG